MNADMNHFDAINERSTNHAPKTTSSAKLHDDIVTCTTTKTIATITTIEQLDNDRQPNGFACDTTRIDYYNDPKIEPSSGIDDENDNNNHSITTDHDASIADPTILDGSTVIPNECTNDIVPEQSAPTAAAATAAEGATKSSLRSEPSLGEHRASIGSHRSQRSKTHTVIRKFQKLNSSQLSSTPSPNVKIGQRVAYKEYYGNEFGTIRWIGEFLSLSLLLESSPSAFRKAEANNRYQKKNKTGRVPQISPDWTVGVEFDNAIGEGDGSLHGRRYFIAKDCFAKFLPLSSVALVDQHVGRPEPGTMISVMAAASQPGQMISIQRMSTVHVQHCFLNAPHRQPTGADILAVNTRLHCQCPNCGPCAHVIKPPTTQRLARAGKNATHMCQFSTYTCCGMESQEETMCTYTGNKVISDPPPASAFVGPPLPPPPPIGHSWIEGSGYLSQLQAQQRKLMPEEYILGAAPEDCGRQIRQAARSSSRRGSGKHHHHHHHTKTNNSGHLNDLNDLNDPNDQEMRADHEPTVDHETPTNERCNESFIGQQQREANKTNPSEHYATMACQLDETNNNEKNDLALNENGHTNAGAPKPSKVIYRNSIENRYLFPTDDEDPIDSTLEEDLENLSQARYGYAAPQTNNNRLRSSSRGLFKSLRSLVSCLNSQSNQSEFEVQSEGTLRYSTNLGQFKNRSEPAAPPPQAEALYANTVASALDQPPPPLYSSTATNSKISSSRPNSRNQQLIEAQAAMRNHQMSSSSDCGFSSASQNSINCLSLAAMSAQLGSPLLEDHLRSQQIYRRIVARMLSNPLATEEDLEKLKNIFVSVGGSQQFDNNGCCLHGGIGTTGAIGAGGQTSLSAADIEQTIAEIASRSFQMQQDKDLCSGRARTCCYCARTSPSLVGQGLEASSHAGHDKMMGANFVGAEANRCSCCLHKDNSFNGVKTLSSQRRTDGSIASADSTTLSSFGSSAGNASTAGAPTTNLTDHHHQHQQQQHHQNGGKSEPRTESSKTVTEKSAANLPKAFELKLTLSINSDGKQSAVVDAEQQQQPKMRCELNEANQQQQQQDSRQLLDIEIRSPDCGTTTEQQNLSRPVELEA